MKIAHFFAGLALCAIATSSNASTPPTSLIPLPAQITFGSGNFTVDAHTHIVISEHNAAEQQAADTLAKLVATSRKLRLPISRGGHRDGAIVLQLDPSAAVTQPEGYTLDVTPGGVRITARDSAGLFYGAISLWQLITPNADHGAVQVPVLHISDQPRFVWRGLMLDSVRHFQSVAEIEQLLAQMAQHKLNVFHWHLTDDQGWRIQIKRYPELTNIGAWRTPPDAGHDGEPARYGGFYTQADIRRVVAFAAARHITVVPEIDMPGHAQAAVASYPAIGVTGKRPAVSIDWGVNPYLYNVDDATFTFINNVLDEVMALFPSRYIHVGGDEAIKDQWQASPAVQAKMRALGITSEDQLQGWFIGRVGAYLATHGRRLIGWDEILDGGSLPANATVMSWRGTDGAIKAARSGHDVVLAPSPDLYFDGLQSDRDDEIAGRLPARSLASVYAFNPVPKGLTPAQAKYVLGVQANVWTEHMPTMQHVEHAVFPRIDALSEVQWSPAASHDWKGFLARLPAQFARYRSQHIAYSDSAFAPTISVDNNAALKANAAQVTLSNQVASGSLRYSTDGSVPTMQSTLYTAPFKITLPTTIRAATFAADGSVLATPRARTLSRAQLLSRSGNSLANCPGSDFRLRVQPMPDATSLTPTYNINVFDSCMLYPATVLNKITSIHIDAVRLQRNYALAHDAKLVVSRPHSTPYGELVVHQDKCDGPTLATLPLPDPAHSDRHLSLQGALASADGEHTLCLLFTAPITGPMYALDRVTLRPGNTP